MSILNFQLGQIGEVGVVPRFIFFDTNNTVAAVSTTGYLNKFVAQGNKVSETDMAVVTTRLTPNAKSAQVNLFNVSFSAGNWSLTANTTPITLLNGQIFIGNSGNIATGVTMSGDATISNTGVLTIASNSITTAKILDGSITLQKLAPAITPQGIIKFFVQTNTVGGAATEVFDVTGANPVTDSAFVQVVNNGAANVSVLEAVVTLNTLTVTFSADPGNDTIIAYQLVRIVA